MSENLFEQPFVLTPNDFIHTMVEKDSEDFLFITPVGEKMEHEMGDVYYHKGAMVPYHVHSKGYETFMIDRGAALVTINGKQCTIGEGDLLHIPPYVAHEFTFLEEGTIWREVFQEMDMYGGIYEKNRILRCFPAMLEDAEALAEFRKGKHTLRPGPVDPEVVSKEEIPQVRPKGSALRSFRFDGVTCNLKVGRWETGGASEMWEFVFDKGVRLEWKKPSPHWELYVVREGKVEVTAATRTYVAGKRDIIHIPAYISHTFRVLEEGTTLHAYQCKAQVLTMLEELDLARTKDPEQLKNAAFVETLMKRRNCYLSGVARD